MSWKDQMMEELQSLQESVRDTKVSIETGVDLLEEGIKARDVERRKILLCEMKKLLGKLNEVDKRIMKDLKGEAFDFLRNMRRVSDEIETFKAAVVESSPETNRNLRNEVDALTSKVKNLEMDDFVGCLDISVATNSESMMFGFEKVADGIFLESPVLNSKSLSLEVLPSTADAPNPNYLEIKINSTYKFSSLLLQKTMITMTGADSKVVEECSVWGKIEKNKGEVSENGKLVLVKLQRPRNAATISVTLLGSNIANSPITQEYTSHDDAKEVPRNNLTLGNESIGIFDMTGLEATLDTTGRHRAFLPPGRQNLLSNPTHQPSPVYNPQRKAYQMESMAPVRLNDTTPFNPNPSYASTMRATMAASNLLGALSCVPSHAVTEDGQGVTPENTKIDESDLSILAPSKNSGISIDEMQRSLSGSESGACDKSVLPLMNKSGAGDKSVLPLMNKSAAQLDKSVTFAPETQVVQVLSTPQVSASNASSRFLVAEGKTKPGDGRKGHVRRLDKDDRKEGTNGIWDVPEVDDEYDIDEEYIATGEVAEHSCFLPSEESFLEDPHLMLNASKAPTPLKNWPEADAAWSDVDMNEEENVENCDLAAATLPILQRDNEYQNTDNDDEDPHLMLNASKAPSPQSEWSKEDSMWDWGFEQSPTKWNQRDFDHTMWDNETRHGYKFDFREPFEISSVHESQVASSSTQYCLVTPHSIAYLPHTSLIVVTEPEHHRVGCYSVQQGLKFYSWLRYPKKYQTRQQFIYPTSILSLSTNNLLVLLEKDHLHIFDASGIWIQRIAGEYNGLAEGSNGEIFTLGKNSSGQPVIVKCEKQGSLYKNSGQMVITALQEFDNWEMISQARCLMFSKGKIYITDEGLHKLIVVELSTKKQTVSGYLGSKLGQFKQPTAMLADEVGNVLVADSGNNRLLVYTEEGKFLRVMQQKDVVRLSSPQGLARMGDAVLAVFRGEEGEGGKVAAAVVKFKVAKDSGVSTPDDASELD